MEEPAALHRDLVLVGGGHAHALALRMLAMKPVRGLRITLVSPQRLTPYSGMLPGLVAGHYSFEQTHIDLDRLCRWAQVRFIEAAVTGLNPVTRELHFEDRPPLGYDVVSVDIGSQPEMASVPGAAEFTIPVKPVWNFWERWQQFRAFAAERDSVAVSLVGGGAGSVELALSMAHVLGREKATFDLWCAGPDILSQYNEGARRRVYAALSAHGVNVHTNARVERVANGTLHIADGRSAAFDAAFWCTGAAAAPWVARTGLPVDESGFLQVTDTLQSTGDPRVFAAGDIAHQVQHPRPKAGVYAVRQAPALVRNLRAFLLDKPVQPFVPQRRFLSLISLGGRAAVADKGRFHAGGRWVWAWKNRIDTAFMRKFEQLPSMRPRGFWGALPEARGEVQPHCGGCGAKLGADTLAGALQAVATRFPAHVVTGAEDAASVPQAAGQVVLQSVDVLRELLPDPWVQGRIAALHALSDLHACAARPVSALAVVTLPYAAQRIAQRDLIQLLGGAMAELSDVGCVLNGGHTLQGPELSVGFVVNGIARGRSMHKHGGQPGDVLVLTKPLGVGVLFAARMQGLAAPDDIDAAVQGMLLGNSAAAVLAQEAEATACTDVTGFGLAGHLQEMLGDDLAARVDASAVPVLPGALDCLRTGITSTMQADNLRSAATHTLPGGAYDEARHQLLFDPQTSGGLLIACPAARAEGLVTALRAAGYQHARVIGELAAREAGAINAITVTH
jgi:selenide,water dikinase